MIILINSITSTDCIKGIVHPKMKIQSLSTHPHADGKTGEVLGVHKTLMEFHEKEVSL